MHTCWPVKRVLSSLNNTDPILIFVLDPVSPWLHYSITRISIAVTYNTRFISWHKFKIKIRIWIINVFIFNTENRHNFFLSYLDIDKLQSCDEENNSSWVDLNCQLQQKKKINLNISPYPELQHAEQFLHYNQYNCTRVILSLFFNIKYKNGLKNKCHHLIENLHFGFY